MLFRTRPLRTGKISYWKFYFLLLTWIVQTNLLILEFISPINWRKWSLAGQPLSGAIVCDHMEHWAVAPLAVAPLVTQVLVTQVAWFLCG